MAAAINKLPQGCALLALGVWGEAGVLGRSCPNLDMKRRQFIKLLAALRRFARCLCPWRGALRRARSSLRVSSKPRAQPLRRTGDEIGQVGTLQGEASVTRGNAAAVALNVKDPIFKNDTLSTGPNSALGITFRRSNDLQSVSQHAHCGERFRLSKKTAQSNAASFAVTARNGGFRRQSRRQNRHNEDHDTGRHAWNSRHDRRNRRSARHPPRAGTEQPRVKLYPDTDGHVGQIDVFNLQGGRLGTLESRCDRVCVSSRSRRADWRRCRFRFRHRKRRATAACCNGCLAAHNIGRRMTNERLRARRFNRQDGSIATSVAESNVCRAVETLSAANRR